MYKDGLILKTSLHDLWYCIFVGWSNPPGKPTLKVVELNESKSYVSVLVNVTWSPPQYLGGLNTISIYYQLTTIDYDINTTNPYSLLFYDQLYLNIKKSLDVSVTLHYNGSTTDSLYIPSNMLVMKRYDHLLCNAVGEQTV